MSAEAAWPDAIFDILERFDVRQVAYVPDAGHTRLIERVRPGGLGAHGATGTV